MKKIIFATAAAAVMGLSIGVPAASAGVVPTPSPSQPIYHPQRPSQLPEQFEIAIDQVGNRTFNTVLARGPVRLVDGNDTTVNRFLDVLDDRGPNAVNLYHDALSAPLVRIVGDTCSAVLVQHGNWNFRGGRGIYLRERGQGTFTATLLASARLRDFRSWGWNDRWNYNQNMNWNRGHNVQVCPLTGLTTSQILRYIESGRSPIQFDQVAVNVQGVGTASQPSHPIYNPCERPSQLPEGPTPAPVLSAYHGQPNPHETCYPSGVPTPVRLAA